MKIEIRNGKRGESHKLMVKVGGTLCIGANDVPTLMKRLQKEIELHFVQAKSVAIALKDLEARGIVAVVSRKK